MNTQTTLEHRTNRFDVTVGAGDVVRAVQVCPVGDWPNDGQNQHCSEEALNRVVERWKADGAPDILVDFEHQAEQGGTSDTSAAAWASNFRVEPGRGLVADFRMTDVGAEAVSNRRLQYLSVAWYVNKETRGRQLPCARHPHGLPYRQAWARPHRQRRDGGVPVRPVPAPLHAARTVLVEGRLPRLPRRLCLARKRRALAPLPTKHMTRRG